MSLDSKLSVSSMNGFIRNNDQRTSRQSGALKDRRTLVISGCFNHLDYAYAFENASVASLKKIDRFSSKWSAYLSFRYLFSFVMITCDPCNFVLLVASFSLEKMTGSIIRGELEEDILL